MPRLWTSPLQTQIMVGFIEQHGDLVHMDTPRGKEMSERRWRELTEQLNSCGTGDPRPPEKWKKVWSDVKTNTKKKAARIHRAATGTGGGPAGEAGQLTPLEERVLAIINPAAAIGLDVREVGLDQMAAVNRREPSQPTSPPHRRLSPTVLSLHGDTPAGADTPMPQSQIDPNIPGCSYSIRRGIEQNRSPPRRRAYAPSPRSQTSSPILGVFTPPPRRQTASPILGVFTHPPRRQTASPRLRLPTPPPAHLQTPPRAPRTPRRRRRPSPQQLRGRMRQPTAIDRAVAMFLHADRVDREHRREVQQFHQAAALRQEEMQRQWMTIVTRALDLLQWLAERDIQGRN